MYEVNYKGLASYVNDYFYRHIRAERLIIMLSATC